MKYQPQDFKHLLGLTGFSDNLLNNHFTLYQGYVDNTNKLMEKLDQMLKDGKAGTPEYNELKRRFGWEFNGMRLHELYFGSMMKNSPGINVDSKVAKKIEQDFGSLENWQKDFLATGKIRGIGWVILYYDKQADRLFNTWINEHDTGHLSTTTPLLIMDVFEHAFMTDYGLKRAGYLEAFAKAIDWNVVDERFIK